MSAVAFGPDASLPVSRKRSPCVVHQRDRIYDELHEDNRVNRLLIARHSHRSHTHLKKGVYIQASLDMPNPESLCGLLQ